MNRDEVYKMVLDRNKELIFELKWGRLNTGDLPLILKGLELVEILLNENKTRLDQLDRALDLLHQNQRTDGWLEKVEELRKEVE
jgi:hypothetical protein